MRVLLTVAVGLSLTAAVPRTAHAWNADTCNGFVRGLAGPTTLRLNRCSIPSGGPRDQAMQYAREQWAFISGTTLGDRLLFGSGPNSCNVTITLGDLNNDVAFVAPADIDGDAGKARVRRYDCYLPWHEGRVQEADLLISTELPTGRQAFDGTVLGARETAIHEMGHILGMNHEDDVMSVMCTEDSCGKLAEHFYWGQLAYGAESVMPDDVHFAVRWYAIGTGGRPDLAASVWNHIGGVGQRIYSNVSTFVRCPGTTATVRVSHGSKGRKSVVSTAPMQARIVLSVDATIGTSDTAAGYWTVWGNSGAFNTNDFTFTVPAMAPGTYYVGLIINGDGLHSEDTYGNNAVYVRRRIQIPSTC